ncbi:MAG: type II secretion system protein [Hyphomicrobium sp.]
MRNRDGGFTLIETLVATTIFALLLSALYQGLTTGWRGLKIANAESSALTVLSRQLASGGIETPLEVSTATGITADGVAWQTDIKPYAPTSRSNGSAAAIYQGFWVTVTVRWSDGAFQAERSLQATTLKLKKAS